MIAATKKRKRGVKPTRAPKPAKLNEYGAATHGLKRINIPIAKSLEAHARISVAFLAKGKDGPAGWRAEFDSGWREGGRIAPISHRDTAYGDEAAAVKACGTRLAEFWEHQMQEAHSAAAKATARKILSAVGTWALRCSERNPSAPAAEEEAARPGMRSIYAPKGKRVEDLDREINEFVEKRTGIKNAIDRQPGPGTAIAPVPPAGAALDAPLDAAERRQLATLEKTIEKNAEAVFEVGRALQLIRDGRLYRATHSEFGAYCIDRFGFSKSYGHRQIEAAVKHRAAAPIAEKLGIDLSNECQMRALSKLDESDLPNVLRRAARLVPAGDDGRRRITAEVLSRAVKEETTSPDDLKREAAEKKARAMETAGATKLAHVIGGQEPAAETPVRTPAAETVVGSNDPHAPLGVNLRFDEALSELADYVDSLLATFSRGQQHPRLAGLLKFLSKRAADVPACRVCGCSELDSCDGEDGLGCELNAEESICSQCASGGKMEIPWSDRYSAGAAG